MRVYVLRINRKVRRNFDYLTNTFRKNLTILIMTEIRFYDSSYDI